LHHKCKRRERKMKIIKPSFIIEDALDGEKLLQKIEKYGRTCYKSEDKLTPESARKFVKRILEIGHESVIEHEKITVRSIQRDAHVFMRFSSSGTPMFLCVSRFIFGLRDGGHIGHFHALCQFSIFSLKNCLKSSMFRVTRIRPFTTDIAAISPSTNGGVKPFDDNLARSLACHSAALSS
jgi:Thymidylate synthase complementing protein